jgi:hypothetical protein
MCALRAAVVEGWKERCMENVAGGGKVPEKFGYF